MYIFKRLFKIITELSKYFSNHNKLPNLGYKYTNYMSTFLNCRLFFFFQRNLLTIFNKNIIFLMKIAFFIY